MVKVQPAGLACQSIARYALVIESLRSPALPIGGARFDLSGSDGAGDIRGGLILAGRADFGGAG
jgi:hypothetical protein